MHVVNAISAPDVPKILHVDLNAVGWSTRLAHPLTLLAGAFLEHRNSPSQRLLFDYYRSKKIPIVAIGSTNPLKILLKQRVPPQAFINLLNIDPRLIMMGDSNGVIVERYGTL
jgi:hypothetical protein